MLCQLCEKINVTDLVELAKRNYRNSGKKQGDRGVGEEFLYWRHCEGYGELLGAAQQGCELCQRVLEALGEEIQSPEEGVVTYKDALLKMERDGTSLGFYVTIDSEHKEFYGSMGPEMIPRDRETYMKGKIAGIESSRRLNTLGNTSTSATHSANTAALTPGAESQGSKSVPVIKPSNQYIMSYRDMILDRLSFHVETKGPKNEIQSPWPLNFSLQVPRGQAKFVGQLQIGHFALDPNLGSELNFGIARDWIKTCGEKHDECPAMDDKPLPSRVINVGSDDREPFLVSTNHKKGKFIALSHCWGGSVAEEAKLTLKTAETFKDRIPMTNLPANFADAVLITRGLGYEYLWIDCLCIMQDSREDWDIESKHMGNVYRDAIVTLAAAAASKATDGMLHTFTSYDVNGGAPTKLKLSSADNPEDTIDIVQRDSTRESIGHLLHHGPLANRGWTLQEEILSPRTLYFGLQQIYWQCLHHHSSADGIHDYDVHWKRAFRYESIKDRIFNQTLSPQDQDQDQDPHDTKNVNQILVEYQDQMVVDYCRRSLTFQTDKLPAFSGIASLVHQELRWEGYADSVYLAGIWSSHFREGLLWYWEDGNPSCSSNAGTSPMPGFPSWSWAKVTGKLHNFYNKILFPSNRDPLLISYNIIPASMNPYGAIKKAELVLDGYILPMRVSDHGTRYHTSAEIFWDPDAKISEEWGRKSQAWVGQWKGDSWLVVGRKDRRGTERDRNEKREKDIARNGKLNKLPYKVLFIATLRRCAFGLVLKKVKGTQGNANANPQVNPGASYENKDEDACIVLTTSLTASVSLDKDPDDMEADSISKKPTNTGLQDKKPGPYLDLDSEIPTYRRIGLIKFQIRASKKNWNLDQFKWLDMKWERQKVRLV